MGYPNQNGWVWCIICSILLLQFRAVTPATCQSYSGMTTVTVSTYDQLSCAFESSVPHIIVNTSIEFPQEIVIPSGQSYTLVGNSSIALTASSGRLFNATQVTMLSIQAIQLQGSGQSNSLNGGLIYSENSFIRLGGVSLANSVALCGAALYARLSILEISASNFFSNTAQGQGVCGGAVSISSSNLTLTNSSFALNSGPMGGALSATDSNVSLSSLIASYNTANSLGGGLFLMQSSLSLSSCNFTFNSANQRGGGIALIGSNGTMDQVRLSSSSAADEGGCLYASSSAVLFNLSSVQNCSSNNGGGAFWAGGSLELESSQFSDNKADNSGAALECDNAAYMSITQCVFQSNVAVSIGGALSVQGHSTAQLSKSRFADNSATQTGTPISIGGAVSCQYSVFRVVESEFVGNSAGRGGDVFTFHCTAAVSQTVVHSSVADEGSFYSLASSLDFSDSEMYNTTGQSTTSGILCYSSILCTVSNCRFTHNIASELGVISIDTTDANITNCYFEDNVSGGLAGAIYIISSSSASISNCTFTNNSASTYGGAIVVEINSGATVRSSLFVNNVAVSGGAIYAFDHTMLTLEEAVFDSNIGYNSGGAIYIGDQAIFLGNQLTISNCSSTSGGAIYASYASLLEIEQLIATNNSAGYTGGAVSVLDKVSLVIRNSELQANYANLGGAIAVQYSVFASVESTNLVGNVATAYGGSVFAITDCYFSMQNCYMSNNTGNFGGGGIFLQSSVGNITTSQLISNTASMGGAIYTLGSSLTIASSEFKFNGDSQQQECLIGGVISASSSFLSTQDTNYTSNRASSGGVIAVSSSSLSSYGDIFQQCVAIVGGCLYATENSAVALYYSIIRDNNLEAAQTIAEHVFVNDGYFFMQHARVESNVVTSNGAISLYSTSSNIFNSTFQNNVALGSEARGAAVYLACSSICNASASLLVEIVDSVFSNNSAAEGYGGAVFAESFPGRLNVSDCTFEFNNATFGGALAAEAAEVAISSTQFTANYALDGGGAVFWVYSSSASMTVEDCADNGNMANYGPFIATTLTQLNVSFGSTQQVSGQALSAPISVYLLDYYDQVVTKSVVSATLGTTIYCSVLNNSGVIKGSTIAATDLGVALFEDLVITGTPGGMTNLQFSAPVSGIDSVDLSLTFRDCISGEITVQESNGLAICQNCTIGTYSFYPTDTKCTICPDNAYCPGGNVINVNKKYWRVDQFSGNVLECAVRDVCNGGTNTTTQCAEGQTGPYCSVCEDGYTQNQNGKCYSCTSSVGLITGIFATVLFVLVVGSLVAVMKYRHKIVQLYHKLVNKVQKVASTRKFQTLRVKAKIVVAFCQIVYELGPSLSVVFPSNYSSFIGYYSILQLNLISLPNLGCIVETNYYDGLLFCTLAPFIVFAVVALCIQILVIRARRQNERNPWYTVQSARRDTISAAFVISYFVLVNVSTKIFQVFQCETFDDGSSYLVADYSISCEDPAYDKYVTYGVFMIFVYPIGIPLVYAIVLFRNRKRINPDWRKVVDAEEKKFVSNRVIQQEKIKVRNTHEEIDNIKLLFDSYVPKRWYFELFDCARRLLLGAVPVLIFRGSSLQIIIVLLVSLCSVATFMYFNPYIHMQDNHLAIMAQWSITLVVISALIIKLQAITDDYNNTGLGAVLLLLNISVIFVAIAIAFINSKEKERTADAGQASGDNQQEEEEEDKDAELEGSPGASRKHLKRTNSEESSASDNDDDKSLDSDDEITTAKRTAAARPGQPGATATTTAHRGGSVFGWNKPAATPGNSEYPVYPSKQGMEIEMNPIHVKNRQPSASSGSAAAPQVISNRRAEDVDSDDD